MEIAHFIQNAAKGPNIRFVIVRLVPPNLGTGVIGRTRLRVSQLLLLGLHFRDIHISYLINAFSYENVGRFEVSMQDALDVQKLQPRQNVCSGLPDFSLLEQTWILLAAARGNGLLKISLVCNNNKFTCIFHDNAQ